jgi:hypothetical protein
MELESGVNMAMSGLRPGSFQKATISRESPAAELPNLPI